MERERWWEERESWWSETQARKTGRQACTGTGVDDLVPADVGADEW